jgi:hypothetical protein
MGTEGHSEYMYYCIAEGNNQQELMDNYKKNVKLQYNVDINPYYNGGTWSSYYPIGYNELPGDILGITELLEIKQSPKTKLPYGNDKDNEPHEVGVLKRDK